MISYREIFASDREFSWSCLMIDFPAKISGKVFKWADKNIKEEDLYIDEDGYGKENHIHTTIAYGIDPKTTIEEIKDKLKPIYVTLGKITKFDNDENYDVIKIDVSGKELHKLHHEIEKEIGLPGNTFKDYKPHLTIAYVKKGACDDLIGDDTFYGEKILLDQFDFSNPNASHNKFKVDNNGKLI
jgi:hypothetical protein